MTVLLTKLREKYYILFYITIFSIFLTNFKIYVPLFAVNISYVAILLIKKEIKLKFEKWQICLFIFMICSIIGTIASLFIFKHDLNLGNVIKLNLNSLFLISVAMLCQQNYIKINKYKFINFLEFIIIINLIQVIVIYIFGGLFSEFLQGALAQNSDSAYIVNSYTNVIGGENKNIWASKFVFIFIIYLYTLISLKIKDIKQYFYVIFGGLTILLILSRTAQLAVAIPILFYAIYTINTFKEKYSKAMFLLLGIAIGVGGIVFFKKLFHIQFNMSDGGFTRLLIWKEFFNNVFDTHWIIGNGIGYGATFISEVVGRTESNLHNVFLNVFFEIGIFGLISYIGFIFTFLREYINKRNFISILCILIIPVLFIIMMQYFGYDNDIIMVFILFLFVIKLSQKDEKNEK